MKQIFCALSFFLLAGVLGAFEPQIKLVGRKDLVLGIELRQTVLSLATEYLSSPEESRSARIEDLVDPFAFKSATPVLPERMRPADTASNEPVLVDYADAEVLELSAASFAPKVRGTIMRGDAVFLQLEGGVLLKPGTSFPVKLPQAKQQDFTLTLAAITSSGYVLQIGEATKRLPLNDDSSSKSSRIQFSNP